MKNFSLTSLLLLTFSSLSAQECSIPELPMLLNGFTNITKDAGSASTFLVKSEGYGARSLGKIQRKKISDLEHHYTWNGPNNEVLMTATETKIDVRIDLGRPDSRFEVEVYSTEIRPCQEEEVVATIVEVRDIAVARVESGTTIPNYVKSYAGSRYIILNGNREIVAETPMMKGFERILYIDSGSEPARGVGVVRIHGPENGSYKSIMITGEHHIATDSMTLITLGVLNIANGL